jgi:Spy/CpxP family protein refolding chaperone
MKRSRKVLLGILSAVLLLTTFVGVALAAETTAPAVADKVYQFGQGICRGFGGIGYAVAEKLGLTPEEFMKERAAGKSFAEIAKEKNVSPEELSEEIIKERKSHIEEMVKEGVISPEQGEWMIERMQERVKERIENGRRGFGMGYGKGMQGGHGYCGAWMNR